MRRCLSCVTSTLLVACSFTAQDTGATTACSPAVLTHVGVLLCGNAAINIPPNHVRESPGYGESLVGQQWIIRLPAEVKLNTDFSNLDTFCDDACHVSRPLCLLHALSWLRMPMRLLHVLPQC